MSTCISLPASGNGLACGLCDKGLRGRRRRRGSHGAGPTDMGGGEASGSVRSGGADAHQLTRILENEL